MNKTWVILSDGSDCSDLARRWGVPALVARLLLNRGLSADDSPDAFLAPQLKELLPPETLPGADAAAERIAAAAARGEKIVLYGDYDVDGTAGLAILWHMLRALGADVSCYVPHRTEEGYGLNLAAVRKLVEDGAKLVVSVDCGISAHEAAAFLAGAGVPLIITDHHMPPAVLPPAAVIVHPSIGAGSPNPDLCGAGVAFKLAWALARRVSGTPRVAPQFAELLKRLLPLAALGTIADVVSLMGENRVITRHGLTALRDTPIPGLRALIDKAGLAGGRISGYDVGFKIAPRINAAGRMGHARLAVELLTTADDVRGREIALYLEDHNRERQSTERGIFKSACERIEAKGLASDARRAIVLAAEGWHAGVIGIVASRIVERYHRPAVVIALGAGEGQGSGRSIRHFDLHGALDACRDHLLAFGGHRMAAGLRIDQRRIEEFSEAFVTVANGRITGDDLTPKLRLDAEVALSELSLPTAETIANLGPFGPGNPRPKLASGWLTLADEPRCVGADGAHLQATFAENGTRIRAIGFGMASRAEDLKQHRRCRVAFEPTINDYQNRRSVEMQMLDLCFGNEECRMKNGE